MKGKRKKVQLFSVQSGIKFCDVLKNLSMHEKTKSFSFLTLGNVKNFYQMIFSFLL